VRYQNPVRSRMPRACLKGRTMLVLSDMKLQGGIVASSSIGVCQHVLDLYDVTAEAIFSFQRLPILEPSTPQIAPPACCGAVSSGRLFIHTSTLCAASPPLRCGPRRRNTAGYAAQAERIQPRQWPARTGPFWMGRV